MSEKPMLPNTIAVICWHCTSVNVFESNDDKSSPLITVNQRCRDCHRTMKVWVHAMSAMRLSAQDSTCSGRPPQPHECCPTLFTQRHPWGGGTVVKKSLCLRMPEGI